MFLRKEHFTGMRMKVRVQTPFPTYMTGIMEDHKNPRSSVCEAVGCSTVSSKALMSPRIMQCTRYIIFYYNTSDNKKWLKEEWNKTPEAERTIALKLITWKTAEFTKLKVSSIPRIFQILSLLISPFKWSIQSLKSDSLEEIWLSNQNTLSLSHTIILFSSLITYLLPKPSIGLRICEQLLLAKGLSCDYI